MASGHNPGSSPGRWGIPETSGTGGSQGGGVPRRTVGVATRMRFVDALIAFSVYLVVQFAVALVVGIAVAASLGLESSTDLEAALSAPWTILALVAASGVAAVSGVALVAAIRGFGPRALGLRPTSRRWMLAGLGVCALGIVVNIAVVWLYVRISNDASDPQEALMGVAIKGSSLQFLLMLLLGGLFVPIGEELLFRGVLYAWLRRWGLPVGVVLSSLAFGLFHGLNVVFFTAAILGAMLALLYEWSGSLWPPIVAHAANNLFSLVLERLLQ